MRRCLRPPLHLVAAAFFVRSRAWKMASFAGEEAGVTVASNNAAAVASTEETPVVSRDGEQEYPNSDPAAMQAMELPPPEGWDGPPMTVRFIKGCDGDVTEAWRRYGVTWDWRKAQRVNGILEEPQENIKVIKEHYPHAFHRRAREGQLVYIERLGGVDIRALKAGGVELDALLRYYTKLTEFAWRVLDTREEAKLCSILDMRNVGLSDITGDVKTFLTSAASIVSSHYVERSFKIFVIGVPRWFTVIWALVKPFLHENTRKKVNILGASFQEALHEHIDPANLPTEYGGTDTLELGKAPEEQLFLAHIEALNKGIPTERMPVAWPPRNPYDLDETIAPLRQSV